MNNVESKRTRVKFVAAPSPNSKPTKTTITNVALDGSRDIVVNAIALSSATSATRRLSALSSTSSS